MKLKTFIWNHLLTIFLGSAFIPTAILSYQYLLEDIYRFDGFIWIILMFMLVSFGLSIPYAIIMMFWTSASFDRQQWNKQKKAQIGLSMLAVIIAFILGLGETEQMAFTVSGIVLTYGIIGTILIYLPRRTWTLYSLFENSSLHPATL